MVLAMTSNAHIHGEESLIQEYLAPLAAGYRGAFGLKDDCAAFTPTPGCDLVVKTDPVAAGIHFFPNDAPEDIAWKALAVNVSDLAAKAATPRVYLMALSFPEAPTRDWMQRFAAGLAEAQQAFGMHLIGGDTDRRPGPITISITVFGEVPHGEMVRRGTAKPGDLIYVSGALGDAHAGLQILKGREFAQQHGFSDDDISHLLSAYYRPQPRLVLCDSLRTYATAAMDISDGFAKDLGRMCRASGCGAIVSAERLPLSEILQGTNQRPTRYQWSASAISGGDDYEILMTVPPAVQHMFEQHVAKSGIRATPVGQMVAAPGVVIAGADGAPMDLGYIGWDHF